MDWYAFQQPGLELDFLDEVDKTIRFINQNPYAYAVKYIRKGISIRIAPLQRFPFVVVYFFDELQGLVIIEAVWHTARNPKNWKSRLH